jgi:hypothetical protein
MSLLLAVLAVVAAWRPPVAAGLTCSLLKGYWYDSIWELTSSLIEQKALPRLPHQCQKCERIQYPKPPNLHLLLFSQVVVTSQITSRKMAGTSIPTTHHSRAPAANTTDHHDGTSAVFFLCSSAICHHLGTAATNEPRPSMSCSRVARKTKRTCYAKNAFNLHKIWVQRRSKHRQHLAKKHPLTRKWPTTPQQSYQYLI